MAGTDGLSALLGQVVDGKYRVEHLLGRGGMGAVFRAVHLGTDRVVALKVIAPSLADQPEYLARFSREARACGRLRHPGIVDVTDFGIARHDGRPLAYLVMEYLDGSTLADVLRRDPRPPLPWVIDILEQVCSCVEEAHRQGILHRDLKPENIWLEPNRRGGYSVKILDFGLAKLDTPGRPEAHTPSGYAPDVAIDESSADDLATMARPAAAGPVSAGSLEIEQTIDSGSMPPSVAALSGALDASAMSSVAGTPAYMSPEQTRGAEVTPRSDVYSLGVLAYRMITGRVPFEGTVTEVLTAQLERDPPPLRAVRPDVHEDAARLVAAAMSKDPADRPASAGVFGNMLAAQLEPPSSFFRRGLMLLVDRAGAFLRIGLVACAPFIVISSLFALWQLGHVTLGLPALTRGAAIAGLVAIVVGSLVAQTAVGAMPIFVLHAVAAPLRPLDEWALLRAYLPRLRRWVRAIAPMLLIMVAWTVLAVGWPALLRELGLSSWIRQYSRPVRLLVAVPVLLLPFVVAFLALKRQGLGIRETGLLGAVMLIEGLPFDAAGRRAAELTRRAGALRAAVQKWYLAIIMVVSMAIGVFMGARGVSRASAPSIIVFIAALSPVLLLLLVVNGVLGSLMYLSARRATGESLERIFDDFEKSALSPEQARLVRERT